MQLREFELKIASLRPRIRNLALKIVNSADDADDIAQETLLKMWTIRSRLDQVNSPVALALTIARNKSLDHLRQQKCFADIETLSAIATVELTAEEQIIATECCDEADELMAMLPEGMRTVLKMRHIDGMDTTEIAAAIGAREPTVRVCLSRARQRIRQIFETRNRN